MASPISGMDAVDNGDGTATTYYDDGSTSTWRIDTGDAVSATPATLANPLSQMYSDVGWDPRNVDLTGSPMYGANTGGIAGYVGGPDTNFQAPGGVMPAGAPPQMPGAPVPPGQPGPGGMQPQQIGGQPGDGFYNGRWNWKHWEALTPTTGPFAGRNYYSLSAEERQMIESQYATNEPGDTAWAKYVRTAGAGGTGAGGPPPANGTSQQWGEWINMQQRDWELRAKTAAEDAAYRDMYYRTVLLPMSEAQRQQMAQQAANEAGRLALSQAELQWRQDAELRQNVLARAALTGTLDGQDTLAKTEMLARIRQEDTRLAQQESQFARTFGLNVAQTAASLQGPRNAFQQQALIHGLNRSGLSNAVDILRSRAPNVGFQAPLSTPQAATLDTLLADITGRGAAGAPYMPVDTNAYLNALPNPNEIVGREWVDLDEDTRDFLTSAYAAKGFSPNQLQTTIQRGLPGFQAPTRGAVA